MQRTNVILTLIAAAALSIGGAMAMPVEQDWYDERGMTEDGRLDIRDVDDQSTAMEVPLSRQVMVLQTQIDVLRRKIDRLSAEVDSLK
jgi:hypothetical protein